MFQARLDRMTNILLQNKIVPEDYVYITSAIVGEIGNNSFDHNIGNWPDIAGILFGYEVSDKTIEIVLSDRGVGVLSTLKRARLSLTTEADALKTAFTERLSGRLPERRGNGLKFVKESVSAQHLHLVFHSGNAQAKLNEQILILETPKAISGCLAILTIPNLSDIV